MDKKLLRAQVEAKIDAALADFTKDLSDKKYKKHIKKAAKILSDGLTVASSPKKAAATSTSSAPVVKKAKAAPKKAAKPAKAAKTAKVAKKAAAKSTAA